MAELTFWTNPMSRARIVRWMLEEVGAEYETVVLGYGVEMKAPEYLAVNPMGKVPAIRHQGAVVTEAAAICTYLADAFPGAGLAPDAASPERGPYYRWLFYGAGPVEAAVTNRAMGFAAPDKAQTLGYGSFEAVMDTLQTLAEGMQAEGRPYILGERCSAADVYLGSQIGWGLAFGTMEERPGFRAYAERLTSRPAAVSARQKDDALMPAPAG